jgi:DNA ligase-1
VNRSRRARSSRCSTRSRPHPENPRTYVIKILTGELRIGLREGLVIDGIAEAFGAAPGDVRRALMAAGDVGTVARAARDGTLAAVEVRYGSPIAFMLASPLAYGSSYKELAAGPWICEDKYDGIRMQVHKSTGSVRLYSRTLNDVARAFPEIVDAIGATADDCILDGELLAVRDGRVLPFRFLQTRLQRKDPSAELQREVPVQFVAFDLLARGAEFLLDEPLATRRAALAHTVVQGERIAVAPSIALAAGATPEELHALFDAARERGHEGLVFKRSDAPYQPGKRGKAWLKLKRELTTLDVVVVGVEWGHGKRAQVLSDYTFAVRGPHGSLLPIGKAYSGLTDVEIGEMTQWFLAHRLPDEAAAREYAELGLGRHEIVVEPATVIEVAFDVVQRSELHKSGFSLRFPRIVRLRPDRSPADIASLDDVERIHEEMLRREDGSAIMGT